jgi:hypothetical protein
MCGACRWPEELAYLGKEARGGTLKGTLHRRWALRADGAWSGVTQATFPTVSIPCGNFKVGMRASGWAMARKFKEDGC